jgi:DNA topoisomerase-1
VLQAPAPGLTTLRRKNLEFQPEGIVFKFKGKGQKYSEVKVKSKRFKNLIKKCSELTGYEVFRYKDESGKTFPIESKDVNQYLKEISGENFTSKNFRTWGATALAIKNYPVALQKVRKNKKLKLKRAIVKEVAKELNNTITVCEKYYIHPKVLEALSNEKYTPDQFNIQDKPKKLKKEEKLVLGIIESAD